MTSERIVVTGALGFIGRHLVEVLLAKGLSLTLAVRDVERARRIFPGHPTIDIIPYDSIISTGGLQHARSVVHLAGLAHAPHTTGEDAFRDANDHATLQLVRSVGQSKVRLFVHMSSIAAVTGNASDAVIDDMTEPAPTTCYGRSKLAAEAHVATLAQEGVCAVSLRPPLVVGPDAPGNWARLQRLARSGLLLPFGSVNNRRSMVSVDLLIQAIAGLCERQPDENKSGNYCIADPSPISLADVVKELRAGMAMSARLLPVPVPLFRFVGRLSGKRQWIDSLTGDLVLDPSRFFTAFPISDFLSLRDSIRESGQSYCTSATDPIISVTDIG